VTRWSLVGWGSCRKAINPTFPTTARQGKGVNLHTDIAPSIGEKGSDLTVNVLPVSLRDARTSVTEFCKTHTFPREDQRSMI